MELQILTSSKGTQVVTATNLYKALELPTAQYSKNIKKWFYDIYEFKTGIRKPQSLKDFAKRPTASHNLHLDYFITIELAKKITLSCNSKKKHKFAKLLHCLETQVENVELLNVNQVLQVIDLIHTMSNPLTQKAAEQAHHKTYSSLNNGSTKWWSYRSRIMGYSKSSLQKHLKKNRISSKNRSIQDMLQLAGHQNLKIKTGIIDLLIAMGRTENYAKNIGLWAEKLIPQISLLPQKITQSEVNKNNNKSYSYQLFNQMISKTEENIYLKQQA